MTCKAPPPPPEKAPRARKGISGGRFSASRLARTSVVGPSSSRLPCRRSEMPALSEVSEKTHRALARAFYGLGKAIGRRPRITILLTTVFAFACSAGFADRPTAGPR